MKKKLLACVAALAAALTLAAPASAYTAGGPGRAEMVSAGDKHALAIKSDGSLRVLSIRIEKKVNYFYEVTTSD